MTIERPLWDHPYVAVAGTIVVAFFVGILIPSVPVALATGAVVGALGGFETFRRAKRAGWWVTPARKPREGSDE